MYIVYQIPSLKCKTNKQEHKSILYSVSMAKVSCVPVSYFPTSMPFSLPEAVKEMTKKKIEEPNAIENHRFEI